MRSLSLAEILLAKAAMEKTIAQARQTVKHYHANNGIFAKNGFVKSINSNTQQIKRSHFAGLAPTTKMA